MALGSGLAVARATCSNALGSYAAKSTWMTDTEGFRSVGSPNNLPPTGRGCTSESPRGFQVDPTLGSLTCCAKRGMPAQFHA